MQALTNPYTPNAGAEPQAVVGRDDQLASFDLLLDRLARGRTEQSMIITGLRGVGKTVLLGQFRTAALGRDWVVIELEVRKNDDTVFRREIGRKVRTALLANARRTHQHRLALHPSTWVRGIHRASLRPLHDARGPGASRSTIAAPIEEVTCLSSIRRGSHRTGRSEHRPCPSVEECLSGRLWRDPHVGVPGC